MLLLVLLVAVEGLLRVYDYQNPSCLFLETEVFTNLDQDLKRSICWDNNNLKWSYDPYLHLEPNQHYVTINTNQDGFRGKEISLEKPLDTFRVFVVGGSTVFGVGSSSDSSTIPGYLQKQYDFNSELNVEVINAGIPKAYSFTNVHIIEKNLINFEPDLLIIYSGSNDLARSWSADAYTNPAGCTSPLQPDPNCSIELQVLRFLLKNEYYQSFSILFTNYQIWKINTSEHVKTATTLDYSEQMAKNWQNTWSEICELGKSNNFDVIVTLQPMLGTGSKQLTNEESRNYKLYNQDIKLSAYEDFAGVLPELNTKCTKSKDLRNIFQNINETIFYDAVHTGDLGNEIIAKELFELSLPILKEKSQ